jgi:hypothetical protein
MDNVGQLLNKGKHHLVLLFLDVDPKLERLSKER